MDKPRTKVLKSKSSNSAITTQSDRSKNRKSSSNAGFQPIVLKKRGVYVENKITSTNLHSKGKKLIENSIIKASPRPRPGKKRFLASVLTILSKSTTGTQYPDLEIEKRTEKTKPSYKKNFSENTVLNYPSNRSNGKKYRSKILAKRENDFEQVVVLRSKKDIVNTPSVYSERSRIEEDFKWYDLSHLVKAEGDDTENPVENQETAICNCIADGRERIKEKKVTINVEPTTLVSNITEKPKDKLYNFFVDLLETTLSVYNVNTEYHTAPVSISSSKIALVINESVAKKLDVKKDNLDEIQQKPSICCCMKNENNDWDEKSHGHSIPLSIKLSKAELPPKPVKKRRKIKTDFTKMQNVPKTQSLFIPNKKGIRKFKKKNLLSLFKEQLQMNVEMYEEPENLYQALKKISKNKRRCEHSSNIDQATKYDEGGSTGCRFKRRKVISRSTKLTKNRYNPESELLRAISQKYSQSTVSSRKPIISEYNPIELDESRYSLQVYGYDYNENVPRQEQCLKEKELEFVYDSTPSTSDFDSDDAIFNYGVSNETLTEAQSKRKHGLRTLSQLLRQ